MSVHAFRPNYDWINKGADASYQEYFERYYKYFCEERNIEYNGVPMSEYVTFQYTPPPENLSLSRNSQQSCSPLLAGSVRQAPKVPLDTDWKSVTDFVPRQPRSERDIDLSDRYHAQGQQQQGYTQSTIMPAQAENLLMDGQPMQFVPQAMYLDSIGMRPTIAPTQPTTPGQSPVSGSSMYSGTRTGLNPTQATALSYADDSTMANVFQIRAGTWGSTYPSITNRTGPPFTGVYNLLSQTFDANVSMQDLFPEVTDPRFQAPDEDQPDSPTIGDMLQPDQLTANANRYTQLVGISKDPVTGGYVVQYGRDDRVDYEGKVYSAPPTVNIGAPSPFFDLMTNKGLHPNDRGTMSVRAPVTNDINPAVAPNYGFMSNALRDQAMQKGSRDLVTKRNENLQPLDSRAGVGNPANTFLSYGNFGARSLLSTGNFNKLINSDIFNYTLEARPNTSQQNYLGSAVQGREKIAFFREGETSDIYAASAHQFINQPQMMPYPGIDGAGFQDNTSENLSRAYGMTTYSTDNRSAIDATGLTQTDERVYTRTSSLLQPSAPQGIVDAGGFVTTSSQAAYMPQAPRGLMPASVSSVDSAGFIDYSQGVFAQIRGSMGQQPQATNAGVDSTGFTSTSQAQFARYQIPVTQESRSQAIDSTGFTSTQMMQPAYLPFVGYEKKRTEQVDSTGFGSFETMQSARPVGNVFESQRSQQIDATGMTTTQIANPSIKGSYGIETRSQARIDASGMQDASTANTAPGRTLATQTSAYPGLDAMGYADYTSMSGQRAAHMTAPSMQNASTGVDGSGMQDASNANTYGYYYNLNALSGTQTAQADKSLYPDVLEQAPVTNELQHLQNRLAGSVYAEFGAPTYYVSSTKDSTQQSLNPLANYMNASLPELTGMGMSATASYRIANSQAGQAMFEQAAAADFARGKYDLLSQGIVNLVEQGWSDTDSSPSMSPYRK